MAHPRPCFIQAIDRLQHTTPTIFQCQHSYSMSNSTGRSLHCAPDRFVNQRHVDTLAHLEEHASGPVPKSTWQFYPRLRAWCHQARQAGTRHWPGAQPDLLTIASSAPHSCDTLCRLTTLTTLTTVPCLGIQAMTHSREAVSVDASALVKKWSCRRTAPTKASSNLPSIASKEDPDVTQLDPRTAERLVIVEVDRAEAAGNVSLRDKTELKNALAALALRVFRVSPSSAPRPASPGRVHPGVHPPPFPSPSVNSHLLGFQLIGTMNDLCSYHLKDIIVLASVSAMSAMSAMRDQVLLQL